MAKFIVDFSRSFSLVIEANNREELELVIEQQSNQDIDDWDYSDWETTIFETKNQHGSIDAGVINEELLSRIEYLDMLSKREEPELTDTRTLPLPGI